MKQSVGALCHPPKSNPAPPPLNSSVSRSSVTHLGNHLLLPLLASRVLLHRRHQRPVNIPVQTRQLLPVNVAELQRTLSSSLTRLLDDAVHVDVPCVPGAASPAGGDGHEAGPRNEEGWLEEEEAGEEGEENTVGCLVVALYEGEGFGGEEGGGGGKGEGRGEGGGEEGEVDAGSGRLGAGRNRGGRCGGGRRRRVFDEILLANLHAQRLNPPLLERHTSSPQRHHQQPLLDLALVLAVEVGLAERDEGGDGCGGDVEGDGDLAGGGEGDTGAVDRHGEPSGRGVELQPGKDVEESAKGGGNGSRRARREGWCGKRLPKKLCRLLSRPREPSREKVGG